MKTCKYCGDELVRGNFIIPDEIVLCHRCSTIRSKRTEIATAICAGMLQNWLNINEEQVKQCVVKADWLIAELCRVKP